MSDSIWNDPRITAYVLDELSEEDRQSFEAALEGDANLQAAVAEARNVTGQLEDLFAAEETPTLQRDRRSAIVTPAPASRSWRTPTIALATAASLLILIGGPMWISRQDAMTVGQMAADSELEAHEKESAKGTAIEGKQTYQNQNELAQSHFAPYATVGRAPRKAVAVETDAADFDQEELGTFAFEADRPETVQSSGTGGPSGVVGLGRPKVLLGGEVRSDSQLARGRKKETKQLALPLPMIAGDEIVPDAAPTERSTQQSARASGIGVVAEPKPSGGLSDSSGRVTSGFDGVAGLPGDDQDVEFQNGSFGLAPPNRPRALPTGRTKFGSEDLNLEQVKIDRDLVPLLVELSRLEAALGKDHPNSKALAKQVDVLRNELQTLAEVQTGRVKELLDRDQLRREIAGDRFEPITDNPFKRVAEHSLSTFSVDVDTASYSKTRDFLARAHQLPEPGAVRIEELINYFNYDYQPPTADDVHPFTTHAVVTSCPWNPEHRLARIALKGKVIEKKERPRCNLVFLLDTSGSMNQPNKLPLVVEGMQMLLKQLNKNDRVAITVYAGSAGLVLDSTAVKKKGKKKIRKALTQLNAGGSTNGGAGIALAYQTARDNFITDGVNRVILCTDGDFNVGTTSTDALVQMVEQEAKGGIFLSVLGFGMGNHNDSMLEQISGRGNGNYAFIDNTQEARKVLVDQTSATLVTIAKDVKLQIEFNPTQVASYRLIGYENRVLAKEDFNDDKKDAGEIGAGHAVTAMYEIVPAGIEADEGRPAVDALKYQSPAKPTDAADSDELMTLKLRYKAPDGDTSTLVEFPVADETVAFGEADNDVRFAAAVASFGMQLRRSDFKGTWTLSDVQAVAENSKGEDQGGLRTEFVDLVRKASELMGQQ